MNKWRAFAVAVASTTTMLTAGSAQAQPSRNPEPEIVSSCDSGPWHPDISYTFSKPYSFKYKTTTVLHSQLRISDKNHARVSTRRSGVKLYLERTDGRVCGPRTVVPRGAGWYTAAVSYLNNPGHGLRACIKHPTNGTKCGDWKKE